MLLIMSVILVLVIVSVALPLLWRPRRDIGLQGDQSAELADIRNRKESSYAAILELQMDHRMGKLSDEDYQTLYERYKTEALGAIQAEVETKQGSVSDWDAVIEEEIARRRDRGDEGASLLVCPECRRSCEPGSRFCPDCGAGLDASAEGR